MSKNILLAKKLLPLMQKSGRLIADDITTTNSFAKHIQEIISLGYDGDIHSNFSKFICQNYSLATDDKVKWVGEILLDWVVLDTTRCLTTKKYNCVLSRDIGENKFLDSLSFRPPDFNLEAHPYTEVAITFWRLPLGRIEDLIISGQYDDIFDKILLWRTYCKEPFHNYKYGLNIRSVDEYTSVLFIKKFYDVIETFYDEFTGRNFRIIWQSAVKFFSKEENICQFIQHKEKKEMAAKRERIENETRNRESKIYLEEEKKRRTEIHEENRIKKLTSAKCGQKQKIIVLEMLDECMKTLLPLVTGRLGFARAGLKRLLLVEPMV